MNCDHSTMTRYYIIYLHYISIFNNTNHSIVGYVRPLATVTQTLDSQNIFEVDRLFYVKSPLRLIKVPAPRSVLHVNGSVMVLKFVVTHQDALCAQGTTVLKVHQNSRHLNNVM